MTDQPKVGLIPLYLALYDEVRPETRPDVEAFAERVAQRLGEGGLEVEAAPVCCVRAEVEQAVADLTAAGVDLLATVHLAYSPSLESVDALTESDLPLLLLDTTPAARFDETATSADMMLNHGIHGVQDLACMLRRRGRDYALAVGHVDSDQFLDEAVGFARAAVAAARLREMTVLVFGDEFIGMGDFAVEPKVLARELGIKVRRMPVSEIAAAMADIDEHEVESEMAADRARFDCSDLPEEVLRTSNHVGLAVRRLVRDAGAGAFSFNFASFTPEAGASTVPFLEASKAMAQGVGYAGEADAMTAGFVGALLRGIGDGTFTEMFCPDWEGGSIFMSHMGECNVALAEGQVRLVEKDYSFGEVSNPAVAVFAMRRGPATLVNLAPGPDDSFDIIAARVEVIDRGPVEGFPEVPHYWIRPTDGNRESGIGNRERTTADDNDSELSAFLGRYSEAGGTHHSALLMGDQIESLRQMAGLIGAGFAVV
jgi:L-arabinose isomerase